MFFHLKRLLFVIPLLCVFFATCENDDLLDEAEISIEDRVVSDQDSVYVYIQKLQSSVAVRDLYMYVSMFSSMADAKVKRISLNDPSEKYFLFTGLHDHTTYYYRFRACNRVDSIYVDGIKSFTTDFLYDVRVKVNDKEGGRVVTSALTPMRDTAHVTIKTIPNEGYSFLKWSDGDTEPNRVVTVAQANKLEAIFSKNVYRVTLISEDELAGGVIGSGLYAYGDKVDISAIANPGYSFVQWSDRDTIAIRTLLLTSDTVLSAVFSKNSYAMIVSASPSEGGTVEGAGLYRYGDTAILSAIPSSDYYFSMWSDGVTSSTRREVVTGQMDLSAIFLLRNTVTLTASPSEGGRVDGGGSYIYGENITISATPNEGYSFGQWSDGSYSMSRYITVESSLDLTASFVANKYDVNLSVSPINGGVVTGSGSYGWRDSVEITAIPADGYTFVGWSDGCMAWDSSFSITKDLALTAQFVRNNYEVTLTPIPTKGGQVIGAGTYQYGESVELFATPAVGYAFDRWSDGNISPKRTVTIKNKLNLNALFVAKSFDLSLSTYPSMGGTVLGGGTYSYGDRAVITAEPAVGYSFVEWNDGDKSSTRTLVIQDNLNMTASFEAVEYKLTLSSMPSNGGIVSGGGLYKYGETAMISATPYDRFSFSKWSDGDTSANRRVKVTDNMNLTALFVEDTYQVVLTATPSNGGIVNGDGTYYYGDSIRISAIPSTGYSFLEWSDGNTLENRRECCIEEDVNLSAIFIPDSFELGLSASPISGGAVKGDGLYGYGDSASISAMAVRGYTFSQWSDGDTSAQRIVSVTENMNLKAYFIPNKYDLTLIASPEDYGNVIGGGTYEYGSSVTIMAKPADGYYFKNWSDGDTSSIKRVVIKDNMDLTGYFWDGKYHLSLSAMPPEGGTVKGSGTYFYWNWVFISATPATGYTFSHWTGNNIEDPKTQNFLVGVKEDMNWTAIFTPIDYFVTLHASDGGSVEGDGVYHYGDTATCIATPTIGYSFDSWSDGSKEEQKSFEVTGSVNLEASFVPTKYNVVLTTSSSGGTVKGGGAYYYGDSVTISAIPLEGYSFSKWSDEDTNEVRSFVVTDDLSLSAIFDANVYDVSLRSSPLDGGTVSGGGLGVYGEEISISATAAEGYEFSGWSDGSSYASRMLIVTKDTFLTALFNLKSYSLSLYALPLGSGFVSGGGTYNYGDTAEISAVPISGYVFSEWGDGNKDSSRRFAVTESVSLSAKFLRTYNLNLQASPTIGGIVDGEGVYASGDIASISAIPDSGYVFVKWSDGSTDSTRNIQMISETSLTAMFAPAYNEVLLSASPVEGGSVEGQGLYYYGESATISAIPSTGYSFSEWSDGDTYAQRNLVVQENIDLKATFIRNSYTLSLSYTGSGMVSGSGIYKYGDTVSISATPSTGYLFSKWSDGDTSAVREVVMYDNISLYALFVAKQYELMLSASPTMGGVVTGGGIYSYGEKASISATAADGYSFSKWSDANTLSSRTFTISGDKSLVATFTPKSYRITLAASPSTGGTVSGGGTYKYGEVVSISAEPLSGYAFSSWSDGNTESTRRVTVSSAKSLTATFVRTYALTLTASPSVGGSVVGEGTYPYGEKVSISAVPNTGYVFVKWSDDVTDADREIKITAKKSLMAIFASAYNDVRLTASPLSGGEVVGDGTYYYGDTATVVAIPNIGYSFEKWSDGNTSDHRSVEVTENMDLTASFIRNRHHLGLVAFPTTGGSLMGGGTYFYGDTALFSATPSVGYSFIRWSDGDTSAIRKEIISEDLDLIAYFKTDSFDVVLTASPTEGGSVARNGRYPYGQLTFITASPANGYRFSGWSDGNTSTFRMISIKENIDWTAYFTAIDYKVSLLASDGGSVIGDGIYHYGDTATIVAVPSTGYSFDAWSDGEISAKRDLIVNGDTTLTANFTPNRYDLSLLSYPVEGGSVSGSGNYLYGDTVVVIATPIDGYAFTKWSDGDTMARRKIVVKEDLSLSALFEHVSDTKKVRFSQGNISKGGSVAEQWRMLTGVEWSYLYVQRRNASNLRGEAVVNGINGCVFLPNNWVQPSDVSFIPSPSVFSVNNYTESQWDGWEKAGAMFLPCAGIGSIYDINTRGFYWMNPYKSQLMFDGREFDLFISDCEVGDSRCGAYDIGHSIRLIHEL